MSKELDHCIIEIFKKPSRKQQRQYIAKTIKQIKGGQPYYKNIIIEAAKKSGIYKMKTRYFKTW